MKPLIRFFKYSLTGGTTFVLDLCLLYLFTDIFHWHYLVAAAVSFTVAVSVNYWFARRFVFSETLRSVGAGYAIFITIAAGGIVIVTGLMYVFVGMLGWPYIGARVAVAGFTGLWNYFLNLYVNFKVAGYDRDLSGFDR